MSNDVTDYVTGAYSSREEDAARLLALAEGALTNPEDLDPVEDKDDYLEAVEALGGDEFLDEDAARDAIWEFPLAIDRKTLVSIQISFGGPNEWIEAECGNYDGGLGIEKATFYAAWGSVSEETRLQPSDALYQLAERYVETLEA